jgi:serine/threonine-protein kinase
MAAQDSQHGNTTLPVEGHSSPPGERAGQAAPEARAGGGSSVVSPAPSESGRSGSSRLTAVGLADPAVPALPTDKTVISKRLPVETPLPALAPPQKLGEALVGKTLDHYELVEFVGGGGMGAVFRAHDTRLGRTVAVKVLSRDHTDEETIKRFRNEAQSAARLDHPNIARVYYVGEAEGWNYIVFEFIEGTNLRDIVERDGPLPIEDALTYTLEVAEALGHAASRDVVHRDIKPSNVLITPDRRVKLVDMGLARLHQVESSSDDLTASGVMLGTFDYISPEQARDPRMADVRSDIYSLGCTLYFMLAGRPPFPEGTAVQKLLQHNADDPPDLRHFRPEIPPVVTALVMKMLAKRPAQRQQSPQELAADIFRVAEQLGLPALGRKAHVVITHTPPPQSLWSRVVPILAPVAALVLLLAVVDALSRRQETREDLSKVLSPKLEPKSTQDRRAMPAGAAGQPETTGAGASPASASPAPTASEAGPMADEGTASSGRVTMAQPMPGPPPATDVGSRSTVAPGPSLAESTGRPPTPAPAAPASAEASQGHLRLGPEIAGGLGAEPLGGGLSTSSGGAAAAVPPRTVRRVIVRRLGAGGAAAADEEVVHSLAEACQLAVLRGAQEIELQFSGVMEEAPLEISLPKLAIVAGAGYQPVIVFRPQQFSSPAERQMIRLTGGSRSTISLQGIELRMELPSVPSSGWALLALHQVQELDLRNCVLTVKDASGTGGTPIHDQTAMLALQPRRLADAMKMMEDAEAMLPSMSVKLSACVARGEATFLMAADDSLPLRVYWSQGLLVTPKRLFEAGGASVKLSSFENFEFNLEHVTAVVPQGLVLQRRPAGMPSQMRLEVRCRDSALRTDAGAALFEFEGLGSASDIKLHYDGDNNLYAPRRVTFLRHRPAAGAPASEEFDLDNIAQWGNNLSSSALVWQSPPPALADLPAHEHRPQDYLVDTATSESGGFDPAVMPPTYDGRDVRRPARSEEPGTEAKFFE